MFCIGDIFKHFQSTLVNQIYIKVKVKWSRYRPGVAQRVGRGIALLFHDRGTRRGWVVSSTPRAHFTPGKDPVPILQEAGWTPGPVWTGGKSRPHRDSIPDRPARSQSLYRLSYPAHTRYFYRQQLTKQLRSTKSSTIIWQHCTLVSSGSFPVVFNVPSLLSFKIGPSEFYNKNQKQ